MHHGIVPSLQLVLIGANKSQCNFLGRDVRDEMLQVLDELQKGATATTTVVFGHGYFVLTGV